MPIYAVAYAYICLYAMAYAYICLYRPICKYIPIYAYICLLCAASPLRHCFCVLGGADNLLPGHPKPRLICTQATFCPGRPKNCNGEFDFVFLVALAIFLVICDVAKASAWTECWNIWFS